MACITPEPVFLHTGHPIGARSFPPKLEVRGLSFWYGAVQALDRVSLTVREHELTALMGTRGSGKSTLMRCLGRLNDRVANRRMCGRILLDGVDIDGAGTDAGPLGRRLGWVAAAPKPFPWSVRGNVACGPAAQRGPGGRAKEDELVESCLRRVGLWDEVKDRLDAPAGLLETVEQQLLCVARAISTGPGLLLLDEPASQLDSAGSARIEDVIQDLRRDHTIVLAVASPHEAARLADHAAFLYGGRVLEQGDPRHLLAAPASAQLRAWI
jgi:phosphate transport system ATP-binding protein